MNSSAQFIAEARDSHPLLRALNSTGIKGSPLKRSFPAFAQPEHVLTPPPQVNVIFCTSWAPLTDQ